ncbi:MAG: ABC transporter substrate-binding protein [Desulfobacterales bacterium]|nr:ABC transporter substrate-binding protein [Desulfobacterales bacterium]
MLKKALVRITVIAALLCLSGTGWTADTIKIGLPVAVTGPYAGEGIGTIRGIEMAVNEINAAGGLLGKQIEMIKYDTQDFAPERVMAAADDLVGKKKVHALHCGWAGWGQDVKAYGKYNVPTFVVNTSGSCIEVYKSNPKQYSNWFQMTGSERPFGIETAYLMAKLPHNYSSNKVCIISTDDSWGMEIAGGIVDGAKGAGWEIAMKEVVPYGTREWGPILTKIRSIKPAWIHVEIVSTPDLVTFYNQFMENPTNSLINFGYGLTLADFLPNMEGKGDGLLGETLVIPNPPPTKEAGDWIERFKKTYTDSPAAITLSVYTGVYMWAEAVKSVGKVDDYDAINKYLASNKFKTIEDRVVWFNEDHSIPTEIWPANHIQIQNGKLETIYLSGKDKKNPLPYADKTFEKPVWFK